MYTDDREKSWLRSKTDSRIKYPGRGKPR